MHFKHKFILILIFLFPLLIFSQQGKLTGTIYDGEYNDVLPFASIFIKETDKGTTSDFEGDYTLDLEEGEYVVVYSFMGYEVKEITGVVVKNKETV